MGFLGHQRAWLKSRVGGRATVVALAVVFVGLVLLEGWVTEDAFILFRTIDNFHAGLGLRWNAFERVQPFSCPLWTLLLIAADSPIHNLFITTLVVSGLLAIGTFSAVRRWCREDAPWRLMFVIGLLVTSKAFVDYSSSGLENPLANFLLAAFVTVYASRDTSVRFPEEDRLLTLVLLSSAVVLTRQDLVLVVGPATLHAALAFVGAGGRVRRVIQLGLLGAVPLLLWEAFALIYFGFPVPNTAFAKLSHGASTAVLHGEAFTYFTQTLKADPLTMLTIALALVLGVTSREWTGRVLAFGIALYLAYLGHIGGDWMLGRFFAAPFLVSALLVGRRLSVRSAVAWSAVVLSVTLWQPLSPIKVWKRYPAETVHVAGVIDPKAGKYGPKEAVLLLQSSRPYLADPVFRAGVAFRDSDLPLVVRGDVGRFGYGAGPEKIVIDSMGLTDPLLSHLPAVRIRRSGHFERDIPSGYLDTLTTGENRIEEPHLAAYYQRIKLITQGPLFDGRRLRTIVKMNLGVYDHWLHAYVTQHPGAPHRHEVHGGRHALSSPKPSLESPASSAPGHGGSA